jgi:hypothetical protein
VPNTPAFEHCGDNTCRYCNTHTNYIRNGGTEDQWYNYWMDNYAQVDTYSNADNMPQEEPMPFEDEEPEEFVPYWVGQRYFCATMHEPGDEREYFEAVDDSRCNGCYDFLCATHRPTHNHDGEWCDNCDHNTALGTNVERCVYDDMAFCDRHAGSHEGHENLNRAWQYTGGDDGRYNNRPPLVGYGRESTLEYIDAEYMYHPLALGKRSAAVEIEAEYRASRNNHPNDPVNLPQACGIGDDGSLGAGGVEVTTPPAKGAMLHEIITDTLDTMKDNGYTVSTRCGMHTHIDLRDKMNDRRFLAHLFNAFYAIEDILYAMQKHKRYANSYSIPLRKQYKFFDMYGQMSGDFDYTLYKQEKTVYGRQNMESEKERKYAAIRYNAFNFHSVYFRGSLEVRLHEGCVDSEVALKWIDVLQHIIARVEKGHSYSTMKELASMGVTRKKVNRFARYFGLTPELKAFVVSRIVRGQGFDFKLPQSIMWGTPIKGRPKRHDPVVGRLNLAYVGQGVECRSCGRIWTLQRYHTGCLSCGRTLVDRWGEMNYRLAPSNLNPWFTSFEVPPAPPRPRRRWNRNTFASNTSNT